jgi:LacI family transcriptional regulator
MGKAIVRLKDIAEKTGFSTNTVSLALRGSPRIPEVTRQRISETAAALNYLPNQIAKSLVSRETQTIGLVLTDLTNPVLTRAAQAVEVQLAARGYGTLFASSNNNLEEEKRVIAMFRSRQVDGMLIYPTRHHQLDHILPLRRANYPIVLLAGDGETGIDTVGIDDTLGARKAVRHLLDRGHRRIGVLDHGPALGNLEKQAGYLAALAEAGLPVDPALIIDPEGLNAPAGLAGMQRLMSIDPRPTAVFAANDSLAIGALRWCQINHLRVPQDVAIIGFDNIDFTSFAGTPLSTVNYAIDSLSDLAVDRLMRLIAAGSILPPAIDTRIEPELIVRESTGL